MSVKLTPTCGCFWQESFASSPDVQLMRCADYFGRAFAAVSPAQFAWNRILRESAIAKAVEVGPHCIHYTFAVKRLPLYLMI